MLDSKLRDFQNVIDYFLSSSYFLYDLLLLEFINQVSENLHEDNVSKLERQRYQKKIDNVTLEEAMKFGRSHFATPTMK